MRGVWRIIHKRSERFERDEGGGGGYAVVVSSRKWSVGGMFLYSLLNCGIYFNIRDLSAVNNSIDCRDETWDYSLGIFISEWKKRKKNEYRLLVCLGYQSFRFLASLLVNWFWWWIYISCETCHRSSYINETHAIFISTYCSTLLFSS